MRPATPLPSTGEVFLDARGDRRALRVSWHGEVGLVVLSLWRGQVCAGTFRLAVDEVPVLIDLLRDGLARSCDGLARSYDVARRDLLEDLLEGLPEGRGGAEAG
jgi:hypothetical protein